MTQLPVKSINEKAAEAWRRYDLLGFISIVTMCLSVCRSGCQTCSVKPRNGALLLAKGANTRNFGRGREQGQPLRRSLRQQCRTLAACFSKAHQKTHHTRQRPRAWLGWAGLGGELADVLSSSRTSRVGWVSSRLLAHRHVRHATPASASTRRVGDQGCMQLPPFEESHPIVLACPLHCTSCSSGQALVPH